MYKKKKIAVVIPAFNEEILIQPLLKTIPKFVDFIIVVDDGSRDKTGKVVKKFAARDKKIILINHSQNQGVGAAIATGYKWCRDNGVDAAAVMSGDGQIDPMELPNFLNPIIDNRADYTKANRLLYKNAFKLIPKNRFLGNAFLSFLTKMSSGYWHIADSQAGYTAINKKMLNLIDWDKMYKRYGQPNDLLVRLNVENAKVKDIPSKPIYRPQDNSDIEIRKVIFTISFLLLKMFFWRLKEKYIIRDFHPLVFFYFFGVATAFTGALLFLRLLYFFFFLNDIPKINFLAFMLAVLMSTQFILFAMWFDMEYNKDLR